MKNDSDSRRHGLNKNVTAGDLDLDREIEYAFDVEEPMAGRAPTGDVE